MREVLQTRVGNKDGAERRARGGGGGGGRRENARQEGEEEVRGQPVVVLCEEAT